MGAERKPRTLAGVAGPSARILADDPKHKPSRKKGPPKGRRHYNKSPKFARGLAAEAFGARYFGWRQWDGFVDLTPAELAAKRGTAI